MDLTPRTKRICVFFIGLIAMGTVAGFSFGSIAFEDASLIVMPIITGLFALVK